VSYRRRDDQEELGGLGRLRDGVDDPGDWTESRDLARKIHATPFAYRGELGSEEAEERDLESHPSEVARERKPAVPGAENRDPDLPCSNTFLGVVLHRPAGSPAAPSASRTICRPIAQILSHENPACKPGTRRSSPRERRLTRVLAPDLCPRGLPRG
jgi:hypothetical protein